MMGLWEYGYSPFMGVGMLWSVIMILFWVAIIWLVLSILRGRGHNQMKNTGAINILRERYAKGEIDKKEFDEKMKDLK